MPTHHDVPVVSLFIYPPSNQYKNFHQNGKTELKWILRGNFDLHAEMGFRIMRQEGLDRHNSGLGRLPLVSNCQALLVKRKKERCVDICSNCQEIFFCQLKNFYEYKGLPSASLIFVRATIF